MRFTRRSLLAALPAAFATRAFAADATPVVSKIVVEDGRLWLGATIAGSKPLLFCLDTGAGSNFLRDNVAKTLGLSAVDAEHFRGLAGRSLMRSVYLAHDVVLGGAVRQPLVSFVSYDFARGLPDDAAGLIAAGLVTRSDSDLDFVRGEWRLWPHGRPDRPGMTRLDSRILVGDDPRWSNGMELTVRINGRAYRLIADTGATGGVLLFSRAARQSGLFDASIPYAPAATSGFGGTADRLSRIVRAATLELGPLSIQRPLITLMDPAQNPGFDQDGLIGLAALQLLDLSTDTRRGCVWAARNTAPIGPMARYRPSGLYFDRLPDRRAKVVEVGIGSPAAAAGLVVGDIIADPPTFAEVIERAGAAPGTEVKLSVSRNGVTVPISFTPRAYL